MSEKKQSPSTHIETFLNFIDQCKRDYQIAYDAVGDFDKLQQDLLHEMEFAENKAERNKVATKMQRMRIERRKSKDAVKELEEIVKFFEVPRHKEEVKQLKELLKKQKASEEFLRSERVYKPRKGDANGYTN